MKNELIDTQKKSQWSLIGKLILISFPIALFFFAYFTSLDLKEQLPNQGIEPEMFLVTMTFGTFIGKIGAIVLMVCSIFKLITGPTANWPKFMIKY